MLSDHYLPSGIGGRDIDIALSDIGKKFVGLKAFSPISDQSDNETAYSDIGQSAIRHQKFLNSTPLHTNHHQYFTFFIPKKTGQHLY
jgi:hypothetical protein